MAKPCSRRGVEVEEACNRYRSAAFSEKLFRDETLRWSWRIGKSCKHDRLALYSPIQLNSLSIVLQGTGDESLNNTGTSYDIHVLGTYLSGGPGHLLEHLIEQDGDQSRED